MGTGQREVGQRMVEIRVEPVVRVVAHGTIGRELRSHMVFCAVVLRLVARDTFGRRRRGISLVARRTLDHRGMTTCQGKSGGGVAESRRFPVGGGVAGFTVDRDSGSGVAGNLRCIVFCLMTRFAFG